MHSSIRGLRLGYLACACFTGLAFPVAAQEQAAANAVEAPKVSVTAEKSKFGAVGAVPDTAETAYASAGDTLDLSSSGGSNPMRAVSLLPGIDSPAIDPFGLANIPGSNKGLRIRGEINMHGNSIGTVEGIPLMGIDPGPGYQFLIDNEDLASVAVYQGPIAPQHLTYFTTTGVVDSLIRWPEAKPSAEIAQSFGDYSFLRTVVRADSGELGDSGVRAFASGSWTNADKWRGSGDAPKGKTGAAFGLTAEPLAGLSAKLFFAYSDMSQGTYRGLTYAQASDLKANRFVDFTSASSATATQAILYQGYNQQAFTDWSAFAELRYQPSDGISLSVKPYYFHENGAYLDGMTSGKVRQWLIDHESYGLTAEANADLLGGQLTLGYWWSSMEPPGPPTAWKMYNPDASGGRTFAMWQILGKITKRHVFNSTYAKAARDFGALHVELGARYVWEALPGINEYNTTGVGNLSYEQALSASSGVVANRSVTSNTREAFLPYAAISYKIAPMLTAKLSSGRNSGAPGFDAWPTFQSNAAAFLAKGITADSLWRSIKPETSVVTDASLRWDFAGGYIEPTVYYANYQNKLVAYDPGIGLSYAANAGKTHSHGVQVSAHYAPFDWMELFTSIAYSRNTFGANLPTLSSASATSTANVAVKGKMVPDAPYWTNAFGASFRIDDFTVSPIARYVGSRFGDSLNSQKVSDYMIFDLNAAYAITVPYGQVGLTLSVDNLFDRDYVGFINNSYYQATSAAGGSYYPGAPRTVWGKISFKM